MSSILEVAAQVDTAAKRAVVVVGMHRSGTSAMTRTLALLGASLPKRLMPAVKDNNEAGFWEPQAIADLNDEILQAQDSDWDDVFAFRQHHYLSNFDRFYAGRAVELLEQEFDGAEVIVLKDPRISVLTNFWDRALREAGYSTHYVIMVRNPLEVAESLRGRDGFPREKSLLLWSSYMVAVERDTRNRDRIFISYDQLINDWRSVRQRIEESAAFPFPRDTAAAANEIDRYLNRRLRHHEASPDELYARSDVPDEVKLLYRIFRDACEGQQLDHVSIEAIEAELAKMDQLLGPLLADFRGRMREFNRELAAEREARNEEAVSRDARFQQAEEELRRARGEIAELVRRLALAEAALESHRAEAEGARHALKKEFEARLEESSAEIAVLTREIEDKRAAMAEARDAFSQREAELAGALEQSRTDSEAASVRLTDRFKEIATLTSMLAEREASERQSREELAWLQETASMLLCNSTTVKGRLMRFLPSAFHLRRQRRLLKRRGLFDEQAYLAANVDVAADGVDPLQHYLKHGLNENRRRR